MNSHVKIALIIIIIGLSVIFAAKFLMPKFVKQQTYKTSDASNIKAEIRVALDSWIGYFPIQSPVFKKIMREAGYLIIIEDDNADYSKRMDKLKKGETDIAVATVDSYIINGESKNFPATIISIIDESKGGDSFIAWKNKIQSLDSFKNNMNYKIAFTSDSPSEHLLKSIGVHFGIQEFLDKSGKWRVYTNGAKDAYKKLMNKSVDAAVVWEPFVTKGLENQDIIKLLGTEDTDKLIVDILLVNRKFSEKNPLIVEEFLTNYFKTLKIYQEDKNLLKKDIIKNTKIKEKNVDSVLNGVKWINLSENVQWFNLGNDQTYTGDSITDVIDSTIKILVESNDFSDNPLPGKDSYTIINSNYIENIYYKLAGQFPSNSPEYTSSLERPFKPITDAKWKKLKEVGTLKIRPITFMSGTSKLDERGRIEINTITENIKHYPNFRIIIKGHTGSRGDKEANKQLSLNRANEVSNYLLDVYNIDPDRLKTIGIGGEEPLKKGENESSRAFNDRLKRVEIHLVTEML